MATGKTDIYVYAHWEGMTDPQLIGILSTHSARGRKAFSFEYNKEWILSPAYDINPSIDKNGLALNIDMDNNALDYDLAKSVGEFFRLENSQMDKIIDEVITVVKNWKGVAKAIGIPNNEPALMAKAFNV